MNAKTPRPLRTDAKEKNSLCNSLAFLPWRSWRLGVHHSSERQLIAPRRRHRNAFCVKTSSLCARRLFPISGRRAGPGSSRCSPSPPLRCRDTVAGNEGRPGDAPLSHVQFALDFSLTRQAREIGCWRVRVPSFDDAMFQAGLSGNGCLCGGAYFRDSNGYDSLRVAERIVDTPRLY